MRTVRSWHFGAAVGTRPVVRGGLVHRESLEASPSTVDRDVGPDNWHSSPDAALSHASWQSNWTLFSDLSSIWEAIHMVLLDTRLAETERGKLKLSQDWKSSMGYSCTQWHPYSAVHILSVGEVAHNGPKTDQALCLNKSIDRGSWDIFPIYGLGEYKITKDAWSVQLKEKNNHMIGENPDMSKKTLKEMENRLKISQEKGRWKRKDK